MSIDPLAEDYTYNSPYAFQENKLGMGIELEGLELVGNDIAQYLVFKYIEWKSNVSGYQNDLHKAIGSRVEAHRTGQERSNVSVANINVSKAHDAIVVTKSVQGIAKETATTTKEIARDGANGLEKGGDAVTAIGVVTAQPEVIAVGKSMSKIGEGINFGLDLVEGKPIIDIAIDKAPNIIIGQLGKEAVKGTRLVNGGAEGNETTESVLKGVEKVFEKTADKIVEKVKESND